MSSEPTARELTLKRMQSGPYRAWVLGLLALIAMFGFIDRQIIASLAQPIKRDLGVTDAQLGLLVGLAFALLNSALTIPIARLADRWRRTTIIGIGLVLWSAATCACGLARSFVSLALARVAVGVGEAAGTPPTSSLVADYFPRDRRTTVAAIYSLAIPAGALIGAAGGGYIAQHADWRLAFVVAGAPGVVLAALLFLTLREPLRGHHDAEPADDAATPSLLDVLRHMAARPGMLHVLAGSTIASMGGFGINGFLAAYFVRRFGLDYAQAGLIYGLISAVPGSVCILGAGLLTDRLGRRDPRFYAWTPGLGALLAAPLYVVSFLQGSWQGAVAILTLTALVQYAYLPVLAGVTQNAMRPRMRATTAAIVGIVTNLVGAGLGPLIVGALSDRFAAHAYGGDFAHACSGARVAAPACAAASASGLQWAVAIFAVVYLWAAVHFALAARTLKRDLAA